MEAAQSGGTVSFLQLLSCWVSVKPWVSLAFGDWKPSALGELAGSFVLTPLVMRSQTPVKIWWDWRCRGTAKIPHCLCAELCKSVTFAENLWDKISTFSVENGPAAEEIMLTLCIHPSFTFCRLSHSRAVHQFPGKGKFVAAVGMSQACSDADLPVRVARQFPAPWVC